MRRRRVLLAGLIVTAGAIFVGQGVGLLRGSSVMVDDSRWALIGGAMVMLGVVLGAFALLRDRG